MQMSRMKTLKWPERETGELRSLVMMKIPSIKRAEASSSEKKEDAMVELGSGYCKGTSERDEISIVSR